MLHWREWYPHIEYISNPIFHKTNPIFHKTQANEMFYTMDFLDAKATLTFQIVSKKQLCLNDIHWQKTTQRKKPEGLTNIDLETKKAIYFSNSFFNYIADRLTKIDLETKKAIYFFNSFFNYIADSDTYTIHFYFSEAGFKIKCDGLNEQGHNAFMKLYQMNVIIHSKLHIEHDMYMGDMEYSKINNTFINSKCVLNPFAKEVIREDDSLPSEEELYKQFSFVDLLEREE
jgi:hypothetical protein